MLHPVKMAVYLRKVFRPHNGDGLAIPVDLLPFKRAVRVRYRGRFHIRGSPDVHSDSIRLHIGDRLRVTVHMPRIAWAKTRIGIPDDLNLADRNRLTRLVIKELELVSVNRQSVVALVGPRISKDVIHFDAFCAWLIKAVHLAMYRIERSGVALVKIIMESDK